MKIGWTTGGVTWPLAAVILTSTAALFAAFFAVVVSADITAKRREQAQIENGLQSAIASLEKVIAANANWDEAVSRLDNQFDSQWAQKNVAEFPSETYDFNVEFVLDANDQPIFAASGSQRQPAEAWFILQRL